MFLMCHVYSQVQQCLEHNAQLRSEINKLRMEQAALSESAELNHVQRTPGKPGAPDTGHDVLRRDFAKLKVCSNLLSTCLDSTMLLRNKKSSILTSVCR